uniref:Uncharacterized protein n=1 Tax=Cucumis melo TaxID=3656 RepID=A0A9I9DSQ2_CUCME
VIGLDGGGLTPIARDSAWIFEWWLHATENYTLDETERGWNTSMHNRWLSKEASMDREISRMKQRRGRLAKTGRGSNFIEWRSSTSP